MRRSLALLPCLLALGLTASGATAAVPSPANSTLPDCMALCPLGDMPFAVVVRDLANNPVIASSVVLDFSLCPGAHICEWWPTDPYLVDLPTRTLRATTDASGSVTFPARVGGTGGAGSVRVYADGVQLRTYALASPDQSGDGLVWNSAGEEDDLMFAARLGTTDPTADFDCDGDVDSSDEVILLYHFSQSCLGWIDPVQKSTWGRLKAHYR